MNYKELLIGHNKFGTTKDNILLDNCLDKIYENIVIAPWWSVSMFESLNPNIEQISSKIFNISMGDVKFSFFQLKEIGAPVMLDEILKLGVSKCKKILFIGSVGSLNDNINIGDLVIPEFSVTGDGASRYLNKNLEDELGCKQYPDKTLTNKLIKVCNKNRKNVLMHIVPNYSIDTIFAQFAHIDYIKSFGTETIEMETASLFKAAKVCGLKATALFVVSDNTVKGKSLYSGRNDDEKKYRHYVRNNIVPSIINDLFKK